MNIKNILFFSTVLFIMSENAMATVLGTPVGTQLGQTLGSVLPIALGNSLPITMGGVLGIGAVSLIVGIKLAKRKKKD